MWTRAGKPIMRVRQIINLKKQTNKVGPSSIHPLSLSRVRPSTSKKTTTTRAGNSYHSSSPKITKKKINKSKLDQAPPTYQIWAVCALPFPSRSLEWNAANNHNYMCHIHVCAKALSDSSFKEAVIDKISNFHEIDPKFHIFKKQTNKQRNKNKKQKNKKQKKTKTKTKQNKKQKTKTNKNKKQKQKQNKKTRRIF